MNRESVPGILHGAFAVDGVAQQVEDTPQTLLAHRNRNRLTGIRNRHPAG